MRLEFAFLADAATGLENGTFDVIRGGVDEFIGETFPATIFALTLIARLSFEPQEVGKQFEFAGELVDREGKTIFPALGGTFEAPTHPRRRDRASWMTLFLNCAGIVFPAPGDYFFRLAIDGQHLADITIEAVLQEQPQ
jgi:hypothetical protein